MNPFVTRGFELAEWQVDAVEAWWRGDDNSRMRGTLEIFTGGGKTLIAMACIARAASELPGLKAAVVVPTEALARQWKAMFVERTHLRPRDVGVLGAGHKDTFATHRVLISVLNSAAKVLPEMAEKAQPLILVVDECHRAGAPTFSQVLKTKAIATLGLSATPEREEVDAQGEPLIYDEQLVGRRLGPVAYSFSLKRAREVGWLPNYEIFHHGLSLTEEEVPEYEALSRKVDDAMDRMREMGIETSRARLVSARDDEAGRLAQAWISATSQRKDLLYKASERERVTAQLVAKLLGRPETPRLLLFHERVGEASHLYDHLRAEHLDIGIALEHSRLATKERERALESFRSGESPVLVSVKSLVEGLDVPEADVGISVASSSSVRQRIQSLGRVLRRQFDQPESPKSAEMHILYVSGTVDEAIYSKEDWSDLTGEGANSYFLWLLKSDVPERQDGPPREPMPTEDQEWERLERKVPEPPVPWLGVVPTLEYSVDTRGNVTNAVGSVIANPQGVARMVEAVRGRPGGRFRVTPINKLVLVFGEGHEGPIPFVAGRIAELFVTDSFEEIGNGAVETNSLKPGDTYLGPATKTHGTFRLRQKRGGVIERSAAKGIVEFALNDDVDDQLVRNARAMLDAWRKVSERGLNFHVNELWHAWFLDEGRLRFLAEVPGGFAWPSDRRSDDAISR